MIINMHQRNIITSIIRIQKHVIILFTVKIHYKKFPMQKNQSRKSEHDLIGSLLDDIDILSQERQSNKNIRPQINSAPPSSFEFDMKLNYDFLDVSTFESPDPEDQIIFQPFLKKQLKRNVSPLQLSQPTQGYRKMSCDSALNPNRQNQQSPISYLDYYCLSDPSEDFLTDVNKIIEWTRDQYGSRKIQQIFDGDNQLKKEIVFYGIMKEGKSLILDKFGNYVFQKILEKGLLKQKQAILNMVWGSILQLSLHCYGCRVIQKSIQYMKGNLERQKILVSQIISEAMILIENQNGNHVIQKCFQNFSHSSIEQFAKILRQNVLWLSYHPYGCRVVQKYLEHYPNEAKCKQALETLLSESVKLSQCQYGNYVMQHIVSKCLQGRQQVYNCFLDNIIILSTNKYASNVIQKAIQGCQQNFSQQLIKYLLKNEKQVILLTKHQFGNYVIQSLITKTRSPLKPELVKMLKENTSEISKSQNGRHVLLQIDKKKWI